MADVKTGMLTLEQAKEAQRLAQEAVRLACEDAERAERVMDEAYAALDKANKLVRWLSRRP